MKKLKIYQETDGFVLERINEFNHSTRRYVGTEKEDVFEALKNYPNLSEFEISCSGELWAGIIKTISNL